MIRREVLCMTSGLLPEQDVLCLDPECAEQRTVSADSHFPFPRAGEIKISPLRQA